LAPGETLPGGFTFADTRVSRIRASTPFSPTPVTVQTAGGPVVINAPNPNLANRTAVIPARNATAIVDFTNFLFRPSILKICKIAGPGVAVGTPFTFNLTVVNPLTSVPAAIAPVTVLAGSCNFAIGPFPANEQFPGIGTFNFNTQIAVTEAAVAGVSVTAITSPTGGPLVVNLGTRTGTLTLNQALLPNNLFNEITFTNAATVVPPPGDARAIFDFDGDDRSDPVIFRPSSGTWWYAASGSGGQARATQFGIATDRLVAADYDGDGRTDHAVYRNGEWHVLASGGGYSVRSFGIASDIPQPGDYDGDGRADLAVYRPSEGTWYLMRSTAGFTAFAFGISTDSPEAADYDGDGSFDAAVYRNGTWYILGSTAGFSAVQFGIAGDRPVPADYDGDSRADMAVYRNGTWHVLRSSGGYVALEFGMNSDVPVPADYDGDGRTDIAVFRASTNVWHILRSGQTESAYTAIQFGSGGDMLMNY
ncbi:MAG TPA: VCBS repeat-containing protein, partial [Pyrinomonadaceae bacterium]